MTLLDTLNQDIKSAMKAKDKERLAVLRTIKASLQNEAIKKEAPLIDEEEFTLLAREMKQRKEALQEFQKANRQDLVDTATVEIAIVQEYLPQPLSEEEIRAIVSNAIKETEATNSSHFGKVMGIVMPQVKGKADGNQVNQIVKELLS